MCQPVDIDRTAVPFWGLTANNFSLFIIPENGTAVLTRRVHVKERTHVLIVHTCHRTEYDRHDVYTPTTRGCTGREKNEVLGAWCF